MKKTYFKPLTDHTFQLINLGEFWGSNLPLEESFKKDPVQAIKAIVTKFPPMDKALFSAVDQEEPATN